MRFGTVEGFDLSRLGPGHLRVTRPLFGLSSVGNLDNSCLTSCINKVCASPPAAAGCLSPLKTPPLFDILRRTSFPRGEKQANC